MSDLIIKTALPATYEQGDVSRFCSQSPPSTVHKVPKIWSAILNSKRASQADLSTITPHLFSLRCSDAIFISADKAYGPADLCAIPFYSSISVVQVFVMLILSEKSGSLPKAIQCFPYLMQSSLGPLKLLHHLDHYRALFKDHAQVDHFFES